MGDGVQRSELDVTWARVRARVEQRRAAGDEVIDGEASCGDRAEQIGAALASAIGQPPFGRERIETLSRLPAGASVHRLVGAVVSRQVGGSLQQIQAYRDELETALVLLADAYAAVAAERDEHWQSALDRLAEVEELGARCRSLERRVGALEVGEHAAPSVDTA